MPGRRSTVTASIHAFRHGGVVPAAAAEALRRPSQYQRDALPQTRTGE